MTDMLSEFGLPSFRTLFNDCVHNFNQRWLTSINGAVRHFPRSCTLSLVFRSLVFSILVLVFSILG